MTLIKQNDSCESIFHDSSVPNECCDIQKRRDVSVCVVLASRHSPLHRDAIWTLIAIDIQFQALNTRVTLPIQRAFAEVNLTCV